MKKKLGPTGAVAAALVLGMAGTLPAVAQDGYRIRPGDTLQIEVLEDPSLNRALVVLPDGSISFPFAGVLAAGGQTIPEVQATIRSAIAGNFAVEPNVFVAVQPGQRQAGVGVGAVRTIDVYLLGEVNEPGLKEVRRGTTFLQAVAQGGGFSRFAAEQRVQLRRTNPSTGAQSLFQIDFKAIEDGAAMSQDIVLQDGDVILVPERRLFE